METENEDKTETTESVAPDAAAPAVAEAGAAGQPEVDPLEAARAEAAQFKERMLRTAADFDNFRKRSRREAEEALRKGRDGLLRELLPVFDNIERAVAHSALARGEASGEADVKSLSEGLSLVIRQFRDTLSRIGVERVDSVGKPFDPSLHEAIQHLETNEHPPGHVAAEVQAAYREGDRLVRPAMVVVAKAPAEAAETPSEGAS